MAGPLWESCSAPRAATESFQDCFSGSIRVMVSHARLGCGPCEAHEAAETYCMYGTVYGPVMDLA